MSDVNLNNLLWRIVLFTLNLEFASHVRKDFKLIQMECVKQNQLLMLQDVDIITSLDVLFALIQQRIRHWERLHVLWILLLIQITPIVNLLILSANVIDV